MNKLWKWGGGRGVRHLMFIFSYGNSVASKKYLNCQFEMVKWDCFPRYGENSTFLRGGGHPWVRT